MADIEIKIGADPSEFEDGMKRAQKSTDDFEKSTKQSGLTAAQSFSLLATGINQALELFKKIGSAIEATLDAYRQQELATNQLTVALENQGLQASELVGKYKDIASALQEKTGVDDDAIVSNLALLQSFIGQQEIGSELAETLVNLGERTGSMESAANILGKAINGNVTALKKFGVEIDDTGTKAERTQEIIEQLGFRVGGAAAAANQGLGGIRGLKSAFGEFLETVGEQFAPVVSEMIVQLKALTVSLSKSESVKSFAFLLAALVEPLKAIISFVHGLVLLIDKLKSKIDSIIPTLIKFSRAGGAPADEGGAARVSAIEEQAKNEEAVRSKANEVRLANLKAAADERAEEQAREDQAIKDNRDQLSTEILEKNEEYQALSVEQQKLFLEANKEALTKSFLTVKEAQDAALNDQLKAQIAANNRYKKEQEQFGATYAAINSVIYSDQVKGAGQAFGELAALQKSNNSTLKTLGKAAAIGQITIKTAESAMNIYAGFSAIPFIGPILGIAAAAGAVAFGAEQVAGVVAAQEGGIVPGVSQGRDSVPMIAEPGELVVPRANFSEVVNAVANQRAAQSPQASSGVSVGAGSGGSSELVARLEFSGDNAEKFLTARQVEARSLGILREAS